MGRAEKGAWWNLIGGYDCKGRGRMVELESHATEESTRGEYWNYDLDFGAKT